MLDQAKGLRKNMTPQEKKVWYQFLRSYPVAVYKQRIIESFVADFYCASAGLVIEIDGSQHYTAQGAAYDEERSLVMQRYGIKTIRFSNYEVDYCFEQVCQSIDSEIKKRISQRNIFKNSP